MDKRWMRTCYRIALIVLAIQGVTPDFRNLSSSWLFRLVSSGSFDLVAEDGGLASLPLPVPDDDQDDGPAEVCAPVAREAGLRLRLDAHGWCCVELLPVGIGEWLARSAPLPFYLHGIVLRGHDGLICTLCRFRC